MKKPSRPEPNTSHLAGEYFAAAELSKRGWAVAMTIGNAKAIDVFAEKGRRTASIQVKSISQRRNVGWPSGHESVTRPHDLFQAEFESKWAALRKTRRASQPSLLDGACSNELNWGA